MKTMICFWLCMVGISAFANIPGGGTGSGPSVTVTDNGNGTVTMANGTISIVITKSSAVIGQIYYAYNKNGTMVTNQVLSGGKNGGQLYWELGDFGASAFTYSLVANNGNYAEVSLLASSATNGVVDIHFSMLRGSPGFYVAPIFKHRAQDGMQDLTEARDNIYFSPIFNWQSTDRLRDEKNTINASSVPAFYSPQENSLVTSGVQTGTYVDKYKGSADFGEERVWGWSSVTDPESNFVGEGIGIWHVLASAEFYNGGPLKSELMNAPMVNMINGGHYYMGGDNTFASGEVWTRVSGPYFIYFNDLTNNITDPVASSRTLFADAQAQAAAEATAWPYGWFTNASYAPASQRGMVAGKLVINDWGNPNATASNMWVGVVIQPQTSSSTYDFQMWMKPYQFWTKTDATGNFVISNVIAGANYTLYAFGPGANGTFMSQNQTGGNPPLLYNLPTSPFSVTVTSGATNNLGTVTWTPSRAGATVFEIGYPDRKGDKFRHGDDWFVGEIGPNPTTNSAWTSTAPSPVWTKFLDYHFDFPNDVNYVVGKSRWSTDWNFINPVYPDYAGNNIATASTITFNLPSAPTNGALTSLYLGFCSSFYAAVIVSVNGSNLGSVGGVTGSPNNSIPSTGFYCTYDSDTSIREENHGPAFDERINFPSGLLHAGANTIKIAFRQIGGTYFANHIMYDYIRLELGGYIPPAPASVTAYVGNNAVLLNWPVQPGATSYNILRSTTSGSGYASITNGVVGPVCGSGPQNSTYLDTTVANGTTYYYVVQSVNPTGASTNSPESSGVTPSSDVSTSAPSAPVVNVTGTNNGVTLSWGAVPGANYYTIQRGTVVNRIGAVTFYTTLDNATTGTSYTDSSGTLGCTYIYMVEAGSAAGTSTNSIAVTGKPVPPPPVSAPANVKLTATTTSSDQTATITWSPVSGAVGYILYRSTNASGPFTFPTNYVLSMMTTSYTDSGLPLNAQYYTVVAMNAGGVSGNSAIVGTPLPAPISLSALPGNSQITLTWSAVSGATGYYLLRGTSSGSENTVVVGDYSGTSYTNTGLANGTTYYYVVAATNAINGIGANSSEASATPSTTTAAARNLVWKGDGTNNIWNLAGAANWLSNSVVTTYSDGDTVTFDNSGSNNVPVNMIGMLQPALVIVSNSVSKNYTFSGTGSITGTNALVKMGPGALTVNATNTYTGGTIVSNGMLTFAIAQAIPASGTISLYNTGAVMIATANGLPNVLVDGTNVITGNGNSGTSIGALDLEGMLSLFVSGGSKVFDLYSTVTGPGTLVLANPSGMSLRFNGTSGSGSTIFNLGTQANFAFVRNAPFAIALGGLAGGPATTLQGANSAANTVTYTIGGANANTEFDGVIANGGYTGSPATVIIKTGTGTQIFTNANTYTGGTTVNGGTLLINNLGGSGTGSGAVTVQNSGTLGGNGIISGAVTVQNGGTLSPGNNGIGALTLGNSLTLNAGCTNFFAIKKSPDTNDVAKVIGALVNGGTLIVTNIGSTALTNGDSFKLFSAASYSGGFANVVLPSLASGLAWNTNSLNTNGMVSVVALTSPSISTIQISGQNLLLSGVGGTPTWPYNVLITTNLMASWSPVATNYFDASGNFSITLTNVAGSGPGQAFYRLQLQ